jgi:hypothetical protein
MKKQMKKLFLGSLLAVCTLLMTSCLDGGNSQESGIGYGVIGYSEKNFKPILKTGGIPVYSVEVANSVLKGDLDDGDCCIFAYTLDRDIPENLSEAVAANGYYTITVTQHAIVPQGNISVSLIDTATVLPDEALVFGIDTRNSVFVEDKDVKKIFLATIHENYSDKQKHTFNMSYAMDQEPELVNGENVYNLFLRVVKTEDDKSITSTQQLLNAFDMMRFIENFQYKEAADNKKVLKFRIKYADSFNKDSTRIEWKASDVLTYTFPIEEE